MTRVNITAAPFVQIVRGGTPNPTKVQCTVQNVRPDTVGQTLHIVQNVGKINKLLITNVQTVNLARIWTAIPVQTVP